MDKLILEKKIDSILRCLTRIRDRLPKSESEFLEDYDAQDVVVLNLTRAVQLSVDIATHLPGGLYKERVIHKSTVTSSLI